MLDLSPMLRNEGVDIIELCTGQTKDGRGFYAFLRMDMDSYDRYRDALLNGGPIDLNSFGTIVHTGWGKKPDAATSSWVMKTYTENSEILQTLRKDASAITDIIKSNSKGHSAQ
jgi:hypothetical protein